MKERLNIRELILELPTEVKLAGIIGAFLGLFISLSHLPAGWIALVIGLLISFGGLIVFYDSPVGSDARSRVDKTKELGRILIVIGLSFSMLSSVGIFVRSTIYSLYEVTQAESR